MLKKTKKGFSLIELLVVIAIIGILSAVGITAYSGYTAQAKEGSSRAQHAAMVSLVNAEMAKCSQGTGSFVWTGACSSETTAEAIDTYMDGTLGMKNPYNTAENAAVELSAVDGNPAADGNIGIFQAGTSASDQVITIRTRINSTPTYLVATIASY